MSHGSENKETDLYERILKFNKYADPECRCCLCPDRDTVPSPNNKCTVCNGHIIADTETIPDVDIAEDIEGVGVYCVSYTLPPWVPYLSNSDYVIVGSEKKEGQNAPLQSVSKQNGNTNDITKPSQAEAIKAKKCTCVQSTITDGVCASCGRVV
jgi:hypothetical protein